MQQSACVSSVLETFPNSVWDEAVESLLERGVATSKFEKKNHVLLSWVCIDTGKKEKKRNEKFLFLKQWTYFFS